MEGRTNCNQIESGVKIPLFGDTDWSMWDEPEEDAKGFRRRRIANIFRRAEIADGRKGYTTVEYNSTRGYLRFSFPTANTYIL
jgi:hypothetical protein